MLLGIMTSGNTRVSLLAILFTLMFGVLGFISLDCICGKNSELEATKITSKRYVPQQVTTSIDPEDGSVDVDVDPEEFWFDVAIPHSFQVTRATYAQYEVGAEVYVSHLIGKWTNARYLTKIHGRTNQPIEK